MRGDEKQVHSYHQPQAQQLLPQALQGPCHLPVLSQPQCLPPSPRASRGGLLWSFSPSCSKETEAGALV